MDDLNQVPWKSLTHAYGSAEDVPELLRALKTASPEHTGDDSPLWCLFGSIWHQGTVYQATSYAVPFLIELAADPQTPDRVGILDLLAAIANGTSYLAVHGDLLEEADFEDKKARELDWAKKAHSAVAAGLDVLMEIADGNSDVCLAAAHVLAQLPETGETVSPLLVRLLKQEDRGLYRAGLILLLGRIKGRSEEKISILEAAVNETDVVQRRAAGVAIAFLKPLPLPDGMRQAVKDAITDDELELRFEDLPWDAAGELDVSELISCLDASDRDDVANELIVGIESETASSTAVGTLIDLLFPRAEKGFTPQRMACDLSPLQARAVRAMANAMEGGKRIFYGHFPQWGLPDTMREWRDLSMGRPPTAVDMSLPLLARPDNPQQMLRPDAVTPDQKILHRHFGLGRVLTAEPDGDWIQLTVQFDEEGFITLSLPSDGSPIQSTSTNAKFKR